MRSTLLTRHFLQRLVDNDLLSPDVDRHETIAAVCATVISCGLFATMLLSVKYLFRPFQSPGWTAAVALDDSFLYVAASMIAMALLAVAEWDALALDGRDTSILGPLPIPHGVIVRAKLSALLLFASAFAIVLNLAPSVIHPALLTAKLQAHGLTVPMLILAHAISTMVAGLFGFVAVLGLRELLRTVLGTTWFERVSVFVQTGLVVSLVTTFLLLPGLSAGVARTWLAPGAVTAYAIPPLWFVGLHEAIGGHRIDQLARPELPAWSLAVENEATVLYRSRRPLFPALAGVAVTVLAFTLVTALALYLWNSRRLPPPPAARTRQRRRWAALTWIAQRTLVRRPAAQAGFFFTLQIVSRSVPHRVAMATSLALGVAAAVIVLHSVGGVQAVGVPSIPIGVLAIQTMVLGVLLGGFRHAVRVPAELRANWTFQVAWSGDERPYLAGVKRAALVSFCLPALIGLLPVHALALGLRLAAAHFLYGLLVALVLTDLLLLGFRKPPFAASYMPTRNLTLAWPVAALLASLSLYGVAWLERLALSTTRGTVVFFVVVGTLFVTLRIVDRWQRRTRVAMELTELPESATERLSLSG